MLTCSAKPGTTVSLWTLSASHAPRVTIVRTPPQPCPSSAQEAPTRMRDWSPVILARETTIRLRGLSIARQSQLAIKSTTPMMVLISARISTTVAGVRQAARFVWMASSALKAPKWAMTGTIAVQEAPIAKVACNISAQQVHLALWSAAKIKLKLARTAHPATTVSLEQQTFSWYLALRVATVRKASLWLLVPQAHTMINSMEGVSLIARLVRSVTRAVKSNKTREAYAQKVIIAREAPEERLTRARQAPMETLRRASAT